MPPRVIRWFHRLPTSVYAFHDPATGLTKIGMSGDVPRRRRQIEKACGGPVAVLAVHEFPTRIAAERAEQDHHRRLNRHRATGEWFRLDDAARAALPALLARTARGWRREGGE